jgi:hypothetical protein
LTEVISQKSVVKSKVYININSGFEIYKNWIFFSDRNFNNTKQQLCQVWFLLQFQNLCFCIFNLLAKSIPELEGENWLNFWNKKSTSGISQPNLKTSRPTLSTKLLFLETVDTMALNPTMWYIDDNVHLWSGNPETDQGMVKTVKSSGRGSIFHVSTK